MASSGPSGRSPYPSRTRRRISGGEATDVTSNASTSFGSPFFMSGTNLLTQARMSPAWSPSAANPATVRRSQQHQPRRFFEDSIVADQDFQTSAATRAPRNAASSSSLFQTASSQMYRKSIDGSILENSTAASVSNHRQHHQHHHHYDRLTPPTQKGFDIRNNVGGDLTSTAETIPISNMIDGMDLTQLRRLAENASGSSSVASSPAMAVCYAGLLYAKTQSTDDAFLYAQTLAKNGQEKRAVRLLERSGLLDPQFQPFEKRLEAVLLAARSLATLEEWEQVLELLEDASLPVRASSGMGDDAEWVSAPPLPLDDGDDIGWAAFADEIRPSAHTVHPISRLCLWRGRAYLETGHPTRAAIYWKRALQIDSKCVEALDFLLGRRIVAPQEAYELIQGLTLEPEVEWLRHYYLARIDLPPQDVAAEEPARPETTLTSTPLFSIHGTAVDASSIHMASSFMATDDIAAADGSFEKDGVKARVTKSSIQRDVDKAFQKLWEGYKLSQSSDLLAMAANRCYRRYELQSALKYCEELSVIDPLCPTAGYVYIATLVALGQRRRLFGVAHDWVEASPKSARAWFAVGSYYYACERYRVAQRHFCRATRLDPRCPEAWIAFGCSFAACDESDQALASFRAAQRLAPGDHSSLLYMGMEYLRTNHLALAQHFLVSAFKTSGGDPLCLHELGVLAYQKGEHNVAIQWYLRGFSACQQSGFGITKVEDLVDACKDSYWEPTLFNLGQCYRKTRDFHLSCHCFERCLALNANHPSIYAALAFTRHLMGDVDKAIDLYHQALSRKPDDPFSSEMLNRALQEALSSKLILTETTNVHDPLSRVVGKPKEGEGLTNQPTVAAAASKNEWARRDVSMMSEDGMNLSNDDSSSSTEVWT